MRGAGSGWAGFPCGAGEPGGVRGALGAVLPCEQRAGSARVAPPASRCCAVKGAAARRALVAGPSGSPGCLPRGVAGVSARYGGCPSWCGCLPGRDGWRACPPQGVPPLRHSDTPTLRAQAARCAPPVPAACPDPWERCPHRGAGGAPAPGAGRVGRALRAQRAKCAFGVLRRAAPALAWVAPPLPGLRQPRTRTWCAAGSAPVPAGREPARSGPAPRDPGRFRAASRTRGAAVRPAREVPNRKVFGPTGGDKAHSPSEAYYAR